MLEFSSDDIQAALRMQVADKDTAAGVIQNLRGFASLQNVTMSSMQEMEEETDDQEEVRRYVELGVICTYYPNGYLPEQESMAQAGTDTPAAESQ